MQQPIDRKEFYRRQHWRAVAQLTLIPFMWYCMWLLYTLTPR